MKIFLGIAGLSLAANILLVTAKAQAQVIAAPNDANTTVNPVDGRFNITGGSQAGTNLFHSFQKFDLLNSAQTANFISNPNIQNILGRVVGGDASVINGLIQVTGSNANLYLLNPAGIIFGANARLDVPAAFTATTANAIGFGNQWFNAVGTNNYALLTSSPGDLAFSMSQPGAIFNAGFLRLKQGQTLTLLGGTVVNTGTLTAPGGNIIIAAVPGENLVRISQPGNLLSLALPIETAAQINPIPFTPASLPQLLTGSSITNATGVTVEDGVVKLTGSGLEISQDPGTVVVSGGINVSGTTADNDSLENVEINTIGDLNLAGTIQARKLKLQAQNLAIQGNIVIEGGIPNGDSIVASNSVDIETVDNLTLDSINIVASSINVKSGGDLTAVGSFLNNSRLSVNSSNDIKLESQNNLLLENTQVRSLGNLTLASVSDNITLRGTDISSTGNIQLQTPQQLQVLESDTGNPALIVGKGQIIIEGTQGIEIQALSLPDSLLRSGGDFNLISNNAITGNARIATGGNFSAGPGSFTQPELNLNGIISSNGNVSFGDYTGSSLKVEARGSIQAGNITITEAGKFSQSNDPDINTLNTGPAVILRAGVTNLRHVPDSPANNSIGEVAFTFPAGQAPQNATLPGSIEVKNISTAATSGFVATPNGSVGSNGYFPAYSVILDAVGEIKAGNIETGDGSVKLTTQTGNIIVNTINTRVNVIDFPLGGANVEIDAGGIFRAQGTFLVTLGVEGGDSLNNTPTSILTSTFEYEGTSGFIGGTIDIKHRGESFIENYTPGTIADNVSGTAGVVLKSSGTNATLYGSLSDRTLPGSSSITVTKLSPNTTTGTTTTGGTTATTGGTTTTTTGGTTTTTGGTTTTTGGTTTTTGGTTATTGGTTTTTGGTTATTGGTTTTTGGTTTTTGGTTTTTGGTTATTGGTTTTTGGTTATTGGTTTTTGGTTTTTGGTTATTGGTTATTGGTTATTGGTTATTGGTTATTGGTTTTTGGTTTTTGGTTANNAVNSAEAQTAQSQLNQQQTQRPVCQPANSTTVAVNPSGNTRGGQRNASQSSQNNPCPASNSSEAVLQQSPQQPTQPIPDKTKSLPPSK